jgi:hypothetical protein
MLLTKSVIIKMNRGNLGYYNRVMKNKYKLGDEVDVPVDILPKSITCLVDVCCDVCKKEYKTTYRNYNDCLGYGFYSCTGCKHIKSKLTNRSKYGTDSFVNVDKRKETMITKYGFYNNNRDKSLKTCIDKYGEDNVSKVDSVKMKKKETNIKNWGVDNVFQSDDIKKRSRLTMIDKYGVEHPNQNIDIFNKSQISGYKINIYNGLYYRGTYELDFLKHCESIGLKVENGPSIMFKINGNNKVYHSDFYIRYINLICEVKSRYTYEYSKEINDIKRMESLKKGYNFIFIIDKDYSTLDSLI